MTWLQSNGNRVALGLGVLALAQIGFLLTARGGAASGPPTTPPGFDFGSVEVIADDGARSPLATGEPVLVLVFHSSCGHCEVLAPDWAEWMRARPADLAVVAVSQEPLESAKQYAARHGWSVPVRSVVVPTLGSPARALVGLTPWVFALDENGHVLVGGHGSEVASVAAVLSARP